MSTGLAANGRAGIRRAAAIASCVLGMGLIFFAFRAGSKSSKQPALANGAASAAAPQRKKPARAWNVALDNVVIVAQELGLNAKAAKESPEPAKVAARIESQLQSLRELYRQESEKNPALMGIMIFQLSVGPAGEVTSLKEIFSRLASPEFKKAARAEVSRWSFQDVLAEGATIQCPLLFVREGMDITTLIQWEKALDQSGEKNAAAQAYSSETPVQQSRPGENHRPPAPTALKTDVAARTPPVGAAKPALAVYQLRFVTSLRKEPNFSSVVLVKLAIGTKVSLLESRGEWIEVREESSGRSGFIRKEFISSH